MANPKRDASLLSLIFISWLNGLIKLASQRPLTEEDLFELCDEDKAETIVQDFEHVWDQEIERADKQGRQPRLWKAMVNFISLGEYIFLITQKVLESLSNFCGSLCLWLFLKYSLESERNTVYLLGAAAGIGVTNFATSFLQHSGGLVAELIGMRLKIACIGVTYKKITTSTRSRQTKDTAGHVVNLVSDDAKKLNQIVVFTQSALITFLDTILALVLLSTLVAWHSTSGVIVMFVFCVSQVYVGKLMSDYRLKQASAADERLTTMNEIITGIRAVKMHAWEWYYRDIIRKIRRKEINFASIKNTLFSISISFSITIKSLAVLTSIISLLYAGIQLTAVNVFTVVALLNTLTNSTSRQIFGMLVVFDGLASIKRIEHYLGTRPSNGKQENRRKIQGIMNNENQLRLKKDDGPEYSLITETKEEDFKGFLRDPEYTCYPRPCLELVRVSSGWTQDNTCLCVRDISLKIDSSKLLMVTGPVGSGKTSLLMTILREIPLKSGRIIRKGKLAYVGQVPWIFTGTVLENILFGKDFDQPRYEKIVDACDLKTDIKHFPKGDSTLIGQRGVMLSGGQRVRVSLARALYADADIFLLDDPLSAVDAKVGKHIFQNLVCQELKDKMTILVTHQLQYLDKADEIIVLTEGSVLVKGPFDKLKNDLIVGDVMSGHSSDETPSNSKTTHTVQKELAEHNGADLVQEDEDKVTGTVSWKLYWNYLRAGLPSVLIVCLILFFSFTQGLTIVPTWWLKVMANMSYQTQKSPNVLGMYGGMVAGSFIFAAIGATSVFASLLRSSEKLHDKMTVSILMSPVLFFDTNSVGRIMNRFSKDIGTMDSLLIPSIFLSSINLLYFFYAIILTGIVNYWLILAVIPCVVVMSFVCRYFLNSIRDLSRLESIRCSSVYAHVSETMEGLEVIHSLQMEEQSVDKFYNLLNLHTEAFSLTVSANRWSALYTSIPASLFIATIAFAMAFLKIDSAATGFLFSYIVNLTVPLAVGLRYAAEVENGMTSVERVKQYTVLPSEPGYERSAEPPLTWPIQGVLSVRDMSMVYSQGGPSVLEDITFDVKPQEKIGIVGRTGAGKSSLLAALFRMPDPQGQVVIDGVDLSTLNIQTVRKAIAVVTQNPVLFSGTLRHNLDPFQYFTDENIWKALAEVQMKDKVSRLDGGLQCILGKNGSGFSVGETQLICLARALLQRCKILVLDEATANVDYETDQLIQMVIMENFNSCTVLTIAHRLNTIMYYDRLLVLDRGHVVEYDSPSVLNANKDGVFAQLVQSHQDNA